MLCSMCRKAFAQNEMEMENYLKDKPICADCMKKIETLLTSEDGGEVQAAVNYIYSCRQQATDPKVAAYLEELLENNADVALELKAKETEQKRKATPVQFSPQTNYFKDKEKESAAGGGLFENVGGKIKAVTKFFCWMGIIICVIVAILLFASHSRYKPMLLPGFIVLIVGPLLCWLSSLAMYALGEITDNSRKSRELMEELLKATREKNVSYNPGSKKK